MNKENKNSEKTPKKNNDPIVNATEILMPQIYGVNETRLDPRTALKNFWKKSWQSNRFVFSVSQTSGTKPSDESKKIVGWENGDIYQQRTGNILENTSMTARVTKIWNLPLTIKKWNILEIQSRITSPNGLFRFHPTFNFQILSGESFSLSHEKNCIAIIAITDGTLHISYSDDGTRDFIASIYITIQ